MPLHTGSVKYTATDTTPGDTTGNTYYDDSEKGLKHYDGTSWNKVDLGANIYEPGNTEYSSDNFTKLLLHCNGNGTDASGNNHTAVLQGSAFFTTSDKYLGSGSLDCNTGNAQADYFTIAASTDFSFGTNAFTIDFWFKIRDEESQTNLFLIGDHNSAGEVKIRGTTDNSSTAYGIEFTALTGGGSQQGLNVQPPSPYIEVNTWTHFALVREDASTLKAYHNGVLMTAGQSNGIINPNNDMGGNLGIRIGSRSISSQNLDGLLDEVRISKGTPRWTSNFTVY